MDIFDGEITNWNEISDQEGDILLFRLSDLTSYFSEDELDSQFEYVPEKINELVQREPGIVAFFRNSTWLKILKDG